MTLVQLIWQRSALVIWIRRILGGIFKLFTKYICTSSYVHIPTKECSSLKVSFTLISYWCIKINLVLKEGLTNQKAGFRTVESKNILWLCCLAPSAWCAAMFWRDFFNKSVTTRKSSWKNHPVLNGWPITKQDFENLKPVSCFLTSFFDNFLTHSNSLFCELLRTQKVTL